MSSAIEQLSKRKFWSRFSEKAEKTRIPFEAVIELTYGCNLRCVHCYNPTHEAKGELTTEQVCRIVDQLADLGTFSLTFTGGEIFNRADAFRIFEYAKGKGFSIILLTNATLLTPEKADRIKGLGPTSVEVSIYGATAGTYEQVTGISGSFHRFVTGVQLLRERKIPLVVKMPVMTLNQHEVEQAKALVESWGIRFVYSTEIHPRSDRSLEPLQYRVSPQDVIRLDEKMIGSRERAADGRSQEKEGCKAARGMFTCNCGKRSLAVTPYGKMNLCVALPIPKFDLISGDVASGWGALVDVVRSAKPSEAYECTSCSLDSSCRQGPMDAWLETGDLNPCVPYFKELATLESRSDQAAIQKDCAISNRAGGADEVGGSPVSPLIGIERKK